MKIRSNLLRQSILLFLLVVPEISPAAPAGGTWWYRQRLFMVKSKCVRTTVTPKNASLLSEFKPIIAKYDQALKSPKITAKDREYLKIVGPRCSSAPTRSDPKLHFVYCSVPSLRESDDLQFFMSQDAKTCAKEVYDNDLQMPETFHQIAAFRALTSSTLGMNESAATRLEKDVGFFTSSMRCLANYSKAKQFKVSRSLLEARDDAWSECGLSDRPSSAQRQACDSLVARNVALGATKSLVEGEVSWPSPTCECKPFRTRIPANDREVCVCTRPVTRCESRYSVEAYPINSGAGSSPWGSQSPAPRESTSISLQSPELLSPQNVLLFELDKDNYVGLVLSHRYSQGSKRLFRPSLLFGSLVTKKVTVGYEARNGYPDEPEAYEVRTNAAKKTVQLFRNGKVEWTGNFNLTGKPGTPLQTASPQQVVPAPPAAQKGVPPAAGAKGGTPPARGITENEIFTQVRTSYKTSIIENGYTAETMTISQSGRHLAFSSLDANARSLIMVKDMDKKTSAPIPLPFNGAAVLGMALHGGWTVKPPALGMPRAAAARLFVVAVSPGNKALSGIYQYDLSPSGAGSPRLILKGAYGGITISHTGQDMAVVGQGTNPGLSVYAVAANGGLSLKYTKKLPIGAVLGNPAFSPDRQIIFVSSIGTAKKTSLYTTGNTASGPVTRFMDDIGTVSVGTSGKDVLVTTKWSGAGGAPDGKIYSLDPKKKSLTLWLDCRGVVCSTPTVDPVRNIAYFSVRKSLGDGAEAGAICSNGGF